MIALAVALTLAAQPLMPAIMGRGNSTCQQWTANLQLGPATPQRIADVAWLEGYLSGVNTASHWGNVASSRNVAEITALIDGGCAERPQDTVVIATGRVMLARRAAY